MTGHYGGKGVTPKPQTQFCVTGSFPQHDTHQQIPCMGNSTRPTETPFGQKVCGATKEERPTLSGWHLTYLQLSKRTKILEDSPWQGGEGIEVQMSARVENTP